MNGSFLMGDDRGFLEEGKKRPKKSNGSNFAS
jgi:hypothetical protein